jgi:hypothetical protein
MNSRVGEGDLRIWGLICGELGLGAILPMVLQYHGYCSRPARVGGAQGTPAAGLRPRPAREKVFLLISCLI